MLKIKNENVYISKLLLKFINTFIFKNLKIKIEKLIYFSFFYWKKELNTIPIYYFFETIFQVRPLIGFYIYIIKKKKKKKIKIKPYFMNFLSRWQKAIYWLTRSIKIELGKQKFYFSIINEFYRVIFLGKSNTLQQKIKFYKTILLFKTSKNYKW
jgi:ribosomal protein S7